MGLGMEYHLIISRNNHMSQTCTHIAICPSNTFIQTPFKVVSLASLISTDHPYLQPGGEPLLLSQAPRGHISGLD